MKMISGRFECEVCQATTEVRNASKFGSFYFYCPQCGTFYKFYTTAEKIENTCITSLITRE